MKVDKGKISGADKLYTKFVSKVNKTQENGKVVTEILLLALTGVGGNAQRSILIQPVQVPVSLRVLKKGNVFVKNIKKVYIRILEWPDILAVLSLAWWCLL